MGESGPKGDIGPIGPPGLKGEKGERGPPGLVTPAGVVRMFMIFKVNSRTERSYPYLSSGYRKRGLKEKNSLQRKENFKTHLCHPSG